MENANDQDAIVKVTINGKVYDTNLSKKLAHHPTSSSDQQLFQTDSGEFFLLKLQMLVDGEKIGPHEIWVDLGEKKPRKSRLCITARVIPLTNRQAMEWCIKTQIPATLRGYLLESI